LFFFKETYLFQLWTTKLTETLEAGPTARRAVAG